MVHLFDLRSGVAIKNSPSPYGQLSSTYLHRLRLGSVRHLPCSAIEIYHRNIDARTTIHNFATALPIQEVAYRLWNVDW